jgi:predicted DCC family thiol-disulfide oxidoreductase YuxK
MSISEPDRSDRDAATALTVFFDGACPLCRREIAFYRKQHGSERIHWFDLSTAPRDRPLAPGLDLGAALARMHVMHPDGTFSSGAGAFVAIWRALPRFSVVGRIAGLAPVKFLLELGYRLFLRVRPLWRERTGVRCDSRCDTQAGHRS